MTEHNYAQHNSVNKTTGWSKIFEIKTISYGNDNFNLSTNKTDGTYTDLKVYKMSTA